MVVCGQRGWREWYRRNAARPVCQIIPIDRGNDNMRQAQFGRRIGHAGRLIRIERDRKPGLDVAERASARAGIPHDHEGCVSLVPALADVGTAGLLAHGVQAVVRA